MLSDMLDGLTKVLSSEWFLELLAAVVAVIWALPRVSAWRERVRQGRLDSLMILAEQAVLETYHAYVEEIKRGREDGKLTLDEAHKARALAVADLLGLAADQFPNLAEEYGQAGVEALIERAVGWLKREGVT